MAKRETNSYDIFDPTIPVLEFRLACFAAGEGYRIGNDRVNFTLRNGELMLIRVPSPAAEFGLPDAAQGLVEPTRGDVLYRGKDWHGLSARAAERRRSEIGRVFAANAWLSNLDVEENVMLRLKRNLFTSRRAMMEQVRETLEALGLESLPRARPSEVGLETLQLAQWVRAFAGMPSLALLEHPVNADGLPYHRLSRAVKTMRDRGGAIIWITARDDVWVDTSLEPRQRFEVEGEAIAACREDT